MSSMPLSQVAVTSPLRIALTSRQRAIRRRLAGWPAICLFLLLLFLAFPVRAELNVDVQIEGVDDELLNNVRAYLTIEQQRNDPTLNESRLRRYHQKAPAEIADALAPFGYYRPNTVASLSEANGRWLARYDIQLGEPVRSPRSTSR